MSIITILKKLKDANMISTTEEGRALFTDCFDKFGISLLLLNDESKFSQIVDTLKQNSIPLQKSNGIYALKIFAVELSEIEQIITQFDAINEMNLLRLHPNLLAEPKNVQVVLENIKKLRDKGIVYKNDNGYDIDLLLSNCEFNVVNEISNQTKAPETVIDDTTNNPLKKYLSDPTLIRKLDNMEINHGEEDVNVALELQKVENQICEEYLLPVDDGWKIVIANKEVNSFQTIKSTINAITKLNTPITFHDALILVLFYQTNLEEKEIGSIIENELFKEGK